MSRIIAAIDDMFFASKVSGAARQSGADLSYARTGEEVLAQARAGRPGLIIFDLNSARCQPLETIKAIKGDEELKGIPLLGYLSHVQTELQQQALAAGCDRVVPRSVFARDLPVILAGVA